MNLLARLWPVCFALMGVGIGYELGGCTPAQEAAIPSDVNAACVLIHAFDSPLADAVCATAEDLAPFVPTILASRASNAASDASARKTAPISVQRVQIAELPPPRSVSTRTCVLWASDAGRSP